MSNAAAATNDKSSQIKNIPTPSDSSVLADIFLFLVNVVSEVISVTLHRPDHQNND